MKTIHIADQVRELTEDELHANFNEATDFIAIGIEDIQSFLSNPRSMPCAVAHDEALQQINSYLSDLEAIRHTIQKWKNDFECWITEDYRDPQTVTAYPEALLSVKEVAEYMGCDISTVYRNHLKNGLQSQIESNGIKKVRVDDLLDYCSQIRLHKKYNNTRNQSAA